MILHVPDSHAEPAFPVLPPGFRFGTSTSAYQVEGATALDGRGPGIWDGFVRQPGRTADGATGEVAADHYRRLDEDLTLIKGLGAGGYRFSFSWSRILPSGTGAVNRAGLAFYDRLVDGLVDAGIRPMATLFHGDLPQALEDDGGWLNRATIEAFAELATLLGERYADRVEHWVPLNEPNVLMFMGYSIGRHAPGHRLMFDSLPVAHHLLLAHSRAVAALREAGATSIGCANNHAPIWPASEDAADVGASKLFDSVWNGLFLEPMLLGRYPADLAPLMDQAMEPGDLAVLRQPLDFYGVNYYAPFKVGAAPEDAPMPFELRELLGHPKTDHGWPIVPDALREWLIMFRARFRAALPPIIITESGCAYDGEPDTSHVVDDRSRIDYLHAHLAAVAEAVHRGVDVRGFYVRSLLDGFEWHEGLRRRFGLVHVDHATGERIPKASFDWYRSVIAAQPRGLG